jgi:chemotaxis regulatin CheY-phosphate phosphatase CheZ
MVLPGLAQEAPAQPPANDETVPVSGGTVYTPIRDEEDRLRDPFKSPFELEKEMEKANKSTGLLSDAEDRLPYSLNELELTGIYLRAEKGYLAIFQIGNDYKWFSAGTKFQDADLVNITDLSVVFQDLSGEVPREVIKELRRGEE